MGAGAAEVAVNVSCCLTHSPCSPPRPGDTGGMKRVRVIVNPKSGFGSSMGSLASAVEAAWANDETEVTYEFSRDKKDSQRKVRLALEDGVSSILVAGGDGMVNTVGRELIGTDTALGVLPCGSGNGFARHFGIPLDPESAARALTNAEVRRIDVGTANDRPFFVTCGMAWDAAIVRSFERSPVRGILPYVFAGAYELFEYRPSRFEVSFDDGETVVYDKPMVFTAANLTQYGGGARIAPRACENDGFLELVVVTKADAGKAVASFARLFDGTLEKAAGVTNRRFSGMTVRRGTHDPIQLDGELVETSADVRIGLIPAALPVLIPRARSADA